jgi:hypothetical protein
MLALPLLAGCRSSPDVALALVGYNYTGRVVEYSVNGASGMGTSSVTTGSVCCLSFRPDTKLPLTVKVKWTLGSIRDFENNRWIPAQPEAHEAMVELTGPIPKDPQTFETHFLPDGSVRAYITDPLSDPYYTLDGKPLRPMP